MKYWIKRRNNGRNRVLHTDKNCFHLKGGVGTKEATEVEIESHDVCGWCSKQANTSGGESDIEVCPLCDEPLQKRLHEHLPECPER